MDTLYCFKIDELNAKITRYEITDYKKEVVNSSKTTISFSAALGNLQSEKHTININWIDKVHYMKLYTFDPDYKNALKLISNEFVEKRNEAYKEYSRWNEFIIHLNKNNQN